jgi:hypothetical protein
MFDQFSPYPALLNHLACLWIGAKNTRTLIGFGVDDRLLLAYGLTLSAYAFAGGSNG